MCSVLIKRILGCHEELDPVDLILGIQYLLNVIFWEFHLVLREPPGMLYMSKNCMASWLTTRDFHI